MIYIELTHYDNYCVKTEHYVKNVDTGIGNMLFQIASNVAYGKKYNSEVYVIGLNTYFRLEELIKENTIFRNINKIENIRIDPSFIKNFDPKKLIYEIPMNDLFRKLNIKSFWADPPAVDIWEHRSTAN